VSDREETNEGGRNGVLKVLTRTPTRAAAQKGYTEIKALPMARRRTLDTAEASHSLDRFIKNRGDISEEDRKHILSMICTDEDAGDPCAPLDFHSPEILQIPRPRPPALVFT